MSIRIHRWLLALSIAFIFVVIGSYIRPTYAILALISYGIGALLARDIMRHPICPRCDKDFLVVTGEWNGVEDLHCNTCGYTKEHPLDEEAEQRLTKLDMRDHK